MELIIRSTQKYHYLYIHPGSGIEIKLPRKFDDIEDFIKPIEEGFTKLRTERALERLINNKRKETKS